MTGKHRGLDAPPAAAGVERKRRSTLDLFNDEMSVLERPLENDVEYYDEVPPPSHGKKVAMFVTAAALTSGGALVAMRHFPPKRAVAEIAHVISPAVAAPALPPAAAPAPAAPAPAAASAAPAPAAPAPAAAAAAPAAAKTAIAANEAAPVEAPAGGDEEQPAADEAPAHEAPVKASAWTKVKHNAGHARHSRADKAGARHHKRHH